MADTALIGKLRKVLALTDSPVEGEAQAAAAMLARLLEAHNLSVADLEKRGSVTAARVGEGDHDLGKAAYKWKVSLANTIAAHYFCHSIKHRTKVVTFVGRPDNVESLKMLYAWLIDQIARLAREERRKPENCHIDPLRWQIGFGEGAVERLGERLEERRRRESANAATTALVIHHATEISDYLERTHGYRVDGQLTEYERKRRAYWAAEEERLARLKETDIEAYYRERPWERPLTPEQEREQEREDRKREARDRRNRNRRTGRSYSYREPTEAEIRAAGEKVAAQKSGRANADRVNLEPFVTDGGATERKRIG